MIKNQLARRNLIDSQRRYYIGKRYEEEKKTITNEKGINQHKEDVVQNEPQAKERTSEKIAKENNINESTVRRNEEYSKAIVCEHYIDDTRKQIDVADCNVRELYLSGENKWRPPAIAMTVRELINLFIENIVEKNF